VFWFCRQEWRIGGLVRIGLAAAGDGQGAAAVGLVRPSDVKLAEALDDRASF
jgi:hypothetical protein